MATHEKWTAKDVVDQQCEAFAHLLKLRQHGTVSSNPKLQAHVDAALTAVRSANMSACALWFPREIERPEPPIAA